MTAPRVSIIIPVFNVTEFLSETLETVFSQKYPNIEVVVVDDGSDNASAVAISRICDSFPGTICIRQSNKGQGLARQFGFVHSSGELIIFLDGDDRLLDGAVSYLVEAMQRNPEAIAVYGKKVLINHAGCLVNGVVFPRPENEISGDILSALLEGINLLSVGSICIKREALLTIDFSIRLRQGEDWVLWCRLAALGQIVSAGDRVVLAIRQHDQNISRLAALRPRSLFAMFDEVFSYPPIEERFSHAELSAMRLRHKRRIHEHFWAIHARERRLFRAKYHKFHHAATPPGNAGEHRVVHLVSNESAREGSRLLRELLESQSGAAIEHIVVSLSEGSSEIKRIREKLGANFRIFEVDLKGRPLRALAELAMYLGSVRPHLIKSWLPSSNRIGRWAGMLLRVPVVIGIYDKRRGDIGSSPGRAKLDRASRPLHVVTVASGARHSRVPQFTGFEEFAADHVDSRNYFYSADERREMRARLPIYDRTLLIGIAVSSSPPEECAYYLGAAKKFLIYNPNTHFVLYSDCTCSYDPIVKRYVEFLGLSRNVTIDDGQYETRKFFSAMDILTVASGDDAQRIITIGAACRVYCVIAEAKHSSSSLRNTATLFQRSDDVTDLVSAWTQAAALPPQERERRVNLAESRIRREDNGESNSQRYEKLFLSIVAVNH